MRRFILITAALLPVSAFAASVKDYQVTGPVTELTDSKIVVQKGSEKWELARDANSKIPATVKVGSKVTLHYIMTATTAEDKTAPAKPITGTKKH